jgi:hypothetical protein
MEQLLGVLNADEGQLVTADRNREDWLNLSDLDVAR